jgi:hypothetical protein
MKAATGFCSCVAGVLLMVLANAGIGAAQTGSDTCVGDDATIGGTCTPLTNATSLSNDNTAVGVEGLESNTIGNSNTATGAGALFNNTEGNINTATGVDSLHDNSVGDGNTATGADAMSQNTTGNDNTATGDEALFDNTTGGNSIAIGANALVHNTTGSFNIGIGDSAGTNLTTGSNNIEIGNLGAAAESNTIRIGTQGTQTRTFIAGISGASKIRKGCDIVVEKTGQVGCLKSSARYKRDIHDMGDASNKLMKLRPVTFTYKEDTTGIHQYGLIAEEVEKVYPELVIDDDDGKPDTVEYQVLPAMLLNEVQKQSRELAQKDAQIAAMQRKMIAIVRRLDALEGQARASRPERVAAAMR